MYTVTIASESDIAEICILAKQYDGGFSKHVTVDVPYATKRYQSLVASGMMTVFALKYDGKIVGGIAGLIFPDMNSGIQTAVECFWFVNPENRGKGLILLDAFENWAKERHCKKVAIIHLEDSFAEVLKRLYLRRGYKLIESHYMKEI